MGAEYAAGELLVYATAVEEATTETLVEEEAQLKLMEWTLKVHGLALGVAEAVGCWKVTAVAPPHWLLVNSAPEIGQLTVCLQTELSGIW